MSKLDQLRALRAAQWDSRDSVVSAQDDLVVVLRRKVSELEASNAALRQERDALRDEVEALRSTVTVAPAVTPERNANAERQRRYRERKKARVSTDPPGPGWRFELGGGGERGERNSYVNDETGERRDA